MRQALTLHTSKLLKNLTPIAEISVCPQRNIDEFFRRCMFCASAFVENLPLTQVTLVIRSPNVVFWARDYTTFHNHWRQQEVFQVGAQLPMRFLAAGVSKNQMIAHLRQKPSRKRKICNFKHWRQHFLRTSQNRLFYRKAACDVIFFSNSMGRAFTPPF